MDFIFPWKSIFFYLVNIAHLSLLYLNTLEFSRNKAKRIQAAHSALVDHKKKQKHKQQCRDQSKVI